MRSACGDRMRVRPGANGTPAGLQQPQHCCQAAATACALRPTLATLSTRLLHGLGLDATHGCGGKGGTKRDKLRTTNKNTKKRQNVSGAAPLYGALAAISRAMPASLLAPGPCAAEAVEWPAVKGVRSRCTLPAALNTRTCGVFVAVGGDRRTASYTGAGLHANDCGAAHTDAPVPDDIPVAYFEVEVLSPGAKGCIGVGFSNAHFSMTRQPGCARRAFV